MYGVFLLSLNQRHSGCNIVQVGQIDDAYLTSGPYFLCIVIESRRIHNQYAYYADQRRDDYGSRMNEHGYRPFYRHRPRII